MYQERDRGVSRVTLGCPGGVPDGASVGEGVRGYDSLVLFVALYQENPWLNLGRDGASEHEA